MKKQFIYIMAVVLIGTCTACHKFLDQDPVSSASDETTWASDNDANASVAACYSLIRSAMNAACSYYTYGDLPTDLFGNVADADYLQIMQMNWSKTVSSTNTYDPKLKLRVYTPFYTAIAQSNRCLHFIDKMPLADFSGNTDTERQERKNKYLGEAFFTRAFNYFYMARIWGDVPLITEYQADISTDTGIVKSAQSLVLDQCIADLNIAKKYLSWKDGTSSDKIVRADKGAALALLAHIYAWKGNYDSCNIACDSVINSGSYTLLAGSNYTNLYKSQSDESIFEISQNNGTEAMNALSYSSSIAYYTLATPYLPTLTIPNWQINSAVLFDLYADTTNDVRYKNTFASISSGSNVYYFCTKYSNIEKLTESNTTFYLLKNNIVVFRLADILLLKAEALAGKSSPDYSGALSLVNQVRKRAGVNELSGLSGTALINTITDERGRELFLEGHRYYDLVRNERITGISRFPYMTHTQFLAGKYYWPLDPTLFILNPRLTQTTFWQGVI